jgi:hypothetical protein
MTAHDALPTRSGPAPRTIGPRPHAQVSQTSPPALHRELAARALELPGVQPADSLVSVPDALAFVLEEDTAAGPLDATFTGSWREDDTFSGGWRPNPGADETVNVPYDIGGHRLA